MCGHSPAPTVAAIARQAARGITTMLPTEDAGWVGGELARRFGLPLWQIAMSATDANRFALRFARQITGRPKVLVFNGCYHGTVDETFAVLDDDGSVVARPGSVGPQVDPAVTTDVVEFNDLDALERVLATGEVACVLAEPALTNIGIVLPDPGFHDDLRRLTRDTGTLLIIDETHTLCAGPGGYTAAHGLEPDMLTLGKPIAGGVPAAAFGFTREVAAAIAEPITDQRRRRRQRHRRHAVGQRPGPGRHPGHPRRGAHRRRLHRDDPAGRALDRRRGRGDRRARPGLDRAAARAAGPSTGSARRPATAARRPPPSTTSSTRSCTSTPSTAASCSRRSTTWRSCHRRPPPPTSIATPTVFADAVAELLA